MDASSASDGAGSRCVGGSAGGDGDSGRPECEAGIEETVSCVNGRKIGHSKGTIYKNTKIENLDERKGRSMITLEKVCFAYEHEVALRYVNLHIEKESHW